MSEVKALASKLVCCVLGHKWPVIRVDYPFSWPLGRCKRCGLTSDEFKVQAIVSRIRKKPEILDDIHDRLENDKIVN